MTSTIRVPRLKNPYLIRLAETQAEIEAANHIVYRNYVGLYWPDDEEAFRRNKYLHSSARHAFVVVEAGCVIGTMSIVVDSSAGLPSDTFQPDLLGRHRRRSPRIAELTSLAIDQTIQHSANLLLYLYSFFMQYSFYYLGLDYLFASCRPNHAHFYVNRLCFEELTGPTPHPYAGNVACQLLVLHVAQAHELLSRRYANGAGEDSFYHFMLVNEHPQIRLPPDRPLKRSRNLDWVAIAECKKAPIAV